MSDESLVEFARRHWVLTILLAAVTVVTVLLFLSFDFLVGVLIGTVFVMAVGAAALIIIDFVRHRQDKT